MLRSAATVDHSRLQSIERILLSTVEDLQRSHDARRVETTAEQDHATATKERKKARRQNHRYEQKSVLIEVCVRRTACSNLHRISTPRSINTHDLLSAAACVLASPPSGSANTSSTRTPTARRSWPLRVLRA